MAKIGDLFVKLGLKADEFKRGIADAKNETKSFGDRVKGMSAAAKVAWAAVAAAVTKFAHDTIKLTQTWGDQWAIQMAGVKGAYESFVRQISSGEGWSNLFANMAEAARVAREVAASQDELFERRVSMNYQEAETQRQISEQQLIMRNASKSDAERIAAADKIIELYKDLGKLKREIAEQDAKDQRTLFKSQTGLNDEETDFLLKNYNLNRKIINDSRAYLEERSKKQKAADNLYDVWQEVGTKDAENLYKDAEQALKSLDEQTSETIKHVAELTRKYDKSSDELVQNMAQAEVAVINVDTEINRASMRATAMKGSLTETQNRETSSAANTEADAAEKILQRVADASKTEVELLDQKYQEEKALLEKYGKDTTELTTQYIAALLASTNEAIDAEKELLEELEPVKIELAEIDTSSLDDALAKFQQVNVEGAALAQAFGSAVAGGFSDACQELMDMFMGLSDTNPGAVVKALLTPIADMAVRTGEMIMASGIAIQAMMLALLNPVIGAPIAIATGAALIAVGTAAKAGLSALASNGAAGSASTAGGSYNSAGSQTDTAELTVYVKGTIKGSDIVLSGQNTLTKWGR